MFKWISDNTTIYTIDNKDKVCKFPQMHAKYDSCIQNVCVRKNNKDTTCKFLSFACKV